MKFTLVYSRHSIEDLARLEKKIATRIIKKIGWFVEQKEPLTFAKALKPPFGDLYRFRFGDYRAIFELNSKGKIILLTILRIKHRKEVYE